MSLNEYESLEETAYLLRSSANARRLMESIAESRRIEIGTGVIDMRYENPLHMAESARPPAP